MAGPGHTDPTPRRYSVERYLDLIDLGALTPDDRVELLEGVIVAMPPSNPRHASALSRVTRALTKVVGDRATVRCQLPLIMGHHGVPDPDVALVEPSEDDYLAGHPSAARLVVEVAESSLKQDRFTKAPLYAAGGVAEYWIVNLPDDCVEVHRQPDATASSWSTKTVSRRGERLALMALPDASVAVDDLLPRRQR